MLSQRLRELRLGKGLTLHQVATELGVTRASVSKWELGQSHPEFSRLEQLARILGVPSSELLQDDASAPRARLYPVVGYKKYMNVGELRFGLKHALSGTYPSTRVVSEGSFFLSLEAKAIKNLWLTNIQPDSLVLFDPQRQQRGGDLVLAHDSNGECHLLFLKLVEGTKSYQSFIGNKVMFHANDYLVTLGVALEAVRITSLSSPDEPLDSKPLGPEPIDIGPG